MCLSTFGFPIWESALFFFFFYFFNLFLGAFYVFWIQVFCQIYILQIPSPILWTFFSLYGPQTSPGQNIGVHSLLQGIFPTQRLNPCLLHLQGDSLPLNHQGSLFTIVMLSLEEQKCFIKSPLCNFRVLFKKMFAYQRS